MSGSPRLATLLVSLALSGTASAVPVLDAAYESPLSGSAVIGAIYRAQTFTVETTGVLTRVEVNITSPVNGTLGFEIWNVNGDDEPVAIPGASLASATISWPAGSSLEWFGADLAGGGLAVSAGDTYALVAPGGGPTGVGQWSFGVGYAGGVAYSETGAGTGVWGQLASTLGDFGFRTFVEAAVPEPASLALFGAALLGALSAHRRRTR